MDSTRSHSKMRGLLFTQSNQPRKRSFELVMPAEYVRIRRISVFAPELSRESYEKTARPGLSCLRKGRCHYWTSRSFPSYPRKVGSLSGGKGFLLVAWSKRS